MTWLVQAVLPCPTRFIREGIVSVIEQHNLRDRSPGPAVGVWYDELLSIYVTQDPDIISQILRSRQWVVAYREPVDRILHATRIGSRVNYDATVYAFDHLPLAHEGTHHQKLRRSFALRLAERKAQIEASIGDVILELLNDALSKKDAELVSDFVLPLVRFVLESYGAPESTQTDVSVSQVLDPLISLGRRRRIEKTLVQMKAELNADPEKNDSEVAQGLSMQVLGGDSLAGSLSVSLLRVLEAHPNTRLCDMTWPGHFAGTGVPYIARRAAGAVAVGTHEFSEGDFIRLYLRDFANLSEHHKSEIIFGAGRHLCPGKKISKSIWASLVDHLSRRPEIITVQSHTWRGSDYVFDHLDELKVRVHA